MWLIITLPSILNTVNVPTAPFIGTISTMKLNKQRESVLTTEEATDYLKERIYATITLLALLATLWWNVEHLSHWAAVLSTVGTLVALWLAIGVSSRMSYQVVNGKRMGLHAYSEILRSHSALLAPAAPVVFLIALSALGLMSLSTALLVSMAILLLTFAGFSLLAGRQIHSTRLEIFITTMFEVLIGIGIIVLKIFAGH